jgi:cystathionine gamma-synthase
MKTGYPRFFIPRVVDQLAKRLLEISKAGNVWPPERDGIHAGAKLALLFATVRHAKICRRALSNSEIQQQAQPAIEVYSVNWAGKITTVAEQDQNDVVADDSEPNRRVGEEHLFLVSYPAELGAKAKSFWQHTGFGISSRRASNWLENAPFLSESAVPRTRDTPDEISLQVNHARIELKRRIAAGQSVPSEGLLVSEDDVFLYHTGMTAIAEVIDATKPLNSPDSDSPSPVAVFGFVPPSNHSSTSH